MLYSLLYFIVVCRPPLLYVQSVYSSPYKSRILSSDDYYCTGKILCYFTVQNVMLLLLELDVVRRSLL